MTYTCCIVWSSSICVTTVFNPDISFLYVFVLILHLWHVGNVITTPTRSQWIFQIISCCCSDIFWIFNNGAGRKGSRKCAEQWTLTFVFSHTPLLENVLNISCHPYSNNDPSFKVTWYFPSCHQNQPGLISVFVHATEHDSSLTVLSEKGKRSEGQRTDGQWWFVAVSQLCNNGRSSSS